MIPQRCWVRRPATERERYDPSIELAFGLAGHFDRRIEDLFDPELSGDGRETEDDRQGTA